MFRRSAGLLLALAVSGLGVVPAGSAQAETLFGKAQKLGNGTVKPYAVVEQRRPTAIGVVFTASALEGLPRDPNTTGRCFDLDKNGRIDEHGECEGDYELRLPMPEDLIARGDVPFGWAAINWNPHGHAPAPWRAPHFDFHFYMASQADINAIRVGGCEFFIDCDDKKRALVPVPGQYIHPDHINVGAAVSRMGNHLIDARTPELSKENPADFTHTWIFGAYDGHITFYEPMITLEYLGRRESACHPIKQPEAWERPGYYPTVYCIRYSDRYNSYTVSLEGMKLRKEGVELAEPESSP